MTEKEFIDLIGKKAMKDYQETGILASITIAQACLESGYGTTDLAINANNLFGMKCILSGNTWKSVWDEKSKYSKNTKEEYEIGNITTIKADFRKYDSFDSSIKDHSLYLSQAKNGNKLRYEGIVGEKNYKKAITIIKNGGYATDSKYIDKICSLIERWELTKFDKILKEEVDSLNIINAVSSRYVPQWGNQKKYISIHYLGVVGQNHDLQADGCGAHYYIYWDGTIYHRCSHDAIVYQVGTAGYYTQKHPYARNSNTIGIELCVKCDGNSKNATDPYWYFTKETQESCVQLVKKLMKDLNIPKENVLRHYDIVNKYCPAPYVTNNKYKTSWTWEEFKAKLDGNYKPNVKPNSSSSNKIYRIRKSWKNEKSQIGAFENLDNAKKACKSGYNVYDWNGKAIYKNREKTPTNNTTPNLNIIIRDGQIHANNFTGSKIKINGIRNSETKKTGIKVLQTAMNLDYNAKLSVDGIAGDRTKSLLKGHTIKRNEKQYMVTALEILLMLKGYNPNGVESPGFFGNGLEESLRKYQKDNGLSIDGIAGYNTFISLIS